MTCRNLVESRFSEFHWILYPNPVVLELISGLRPCKAVTSCTWGHGILLIHHYQVVNVFLLYKAKGTHTDVCICLHIAGSQEAQSSLFTAFFWTVPLRNMHSCCSCLLVHAFAMAMGIYIRVTSSLFSCMTKVPVFMLQLNDPSAVSSLCQAETSV